MQVDVEATGVHWGKTISSKIRVRLDEIEATVDIKLHIKKKH
ncbi:hypothetical protein ACFLT4_04110 [Chloroflexota bacterium]